MLGIISGRKLPTVLLIDDDMVSREVLATVLTMSGYSVHAAVNGDESLAMLDSAACAPEVILMDTQMPGMSGASLIAELRTRSKALVYAISGSSAPDEVVNMADGFLLKPFGPEALEKLLRHDAPEIEARELPTAEVVNPATLSQMRGLMSESAVREIYTAVVADLEKRRGALASAIQRGDPGEVKRLGHAIKGGCGMAGAQQAARIGELLEARGDDLEYSRSMLSTLEEATANLRRMLDAEFPTKGIEPAG